MVALPIRLLASALRLCICASVWTRVACGPVPDAPLPRRYEFVAFCASEHLDLFGPLRVLAVLAELHRVDVSVIAETLDLVTTRPLMAAVNLTNSERRTFLAMELRCTSSYEDMEAPTASFGTDRSMNNTVPSHRADAHVRQCPVGSRVLIITGGLGTLSPYATELVQFVKDTYPRLRYLITVRMGATFAAKAGLLDGRRATTNKNSWAETTAPWAGTVRWVPRARWVQEANVWTSSGISAGIDATLGFVAKVYGKANATRVASLMEYEWHEGLECDPFSDIFDVPGETSRARQC